MVKIIQEHDQPLYMAKCDLMDAFLQIFVHVKDRNLLGLTWFDDSGKQVFYRIATISFGLSSAPKTFDRFANALEFMYKSCGASVYTQHYLDDVITLDMTYEGCQQRINIITETCELAGMPVQKDKTCAWSYTVH